MGRNVACVRSDVWEYCVTVGIVVSSHANPYLLMDCVNVVVECVVVVGTKPCMLQLPILVAACAFYQRVNGPSGHSSRQNFSSSFDSRAFCFVAWLSWHGDVVVT